MAAGTLAILADSLDNSMLELISSTTHSLLRFVEMVKQNKDECAQLMEETYEILNAIIIVHIKSETGGDIPPSTLKYIGKFTETLHKIHTFVEAQQNGSKIKNFFRQGEMSALLKDCKTGLQQAADVFKVDTVNLTTDLESIQDYAAKKHREVLEMIGNLSDSSTDQMSSKSAIYWGSHNSSNSISMLPSEPKIFHGREKELTDMLNLFHQGAPRIVILGAGGMGKTTLARALLHHPEVMATYQQHRVFVACDSLATKVELSAQIGDHLGLKRGKDLTRPVLKHFADCSPYLLILDNLETLWESTESRGEIEEFLSLLTDIEHLALIVTMRGTERPAKIQWTRPFLPPLMSVNRDAARMILLDIADDVHDSDQLDQVLSLADNMPLAISLLAHLVDSEGCSSVISRWKVEKTSLVSEGYDKTSNLNLSISLSLSSPRIKTLPHSQDLLSLLSMLPDGLSDAELLQSKLPIINILTCKTALLATSLAYSDEHNRLKALVPIREYVHRKHPPSDHMLQPLLRYFQELVEFHTTYAGSTAGTHVVLRILSNYSNIHNMLLNELQGHNIPMNSVRFTCNLNRFSLVIGRGTHPLLSQIQNRTEFSHDHRLDLYLTTELLYSGLHVPIPGLETLSAEALKYVDDIDDADLKCKFYLGLSYYHAEHKHDLLAAIKFCQTGHASAISSRNLALQSDALKGLAWMKWLEGDYSAAQVHASEAQRLARISANLFREAAALRVQAMCLYTIGNYRESMSLCNRGRYLMAQCGMSDGNLDHCFMNCQAEVHRFKSEYKEAQSIHTQILEKALKEKDPSNHAFALLNIAEIGVSLGAEHTDVQKNIDTAKSMFKSFKYDQGSTMCDTILADLYLREGNFLAAKTCLERCLKVSWGQSTETVSYCLERLGDVMRWDGMNQTFIWPTVFLGHSIIGKDGLGIHKALQFLGDVTLLDGDEYTAMSLFTMALEGFTQMDVHQSRAQCMLQLGDIFKRRGDLQMAADLWGQARPLFQRSSQGKAVADIDNKLDDITQHMWDSERNQNHLACLANLNTPNVVLEDRIITV